jgi:hypothetical protein
MVVVVGCFWLIPPGILVGNSFNYNHLRYFLALKCWWHCTGMSAVQKIRQQLRDAPPARLDSGAQPVSVA